MSDPITPRLWFIGPFPPPLNGQSHYNATLHDMLKKRTEVCTLSTGEGISGKLRAALINPLIMLSQVRRGDTVYTSAPGQMGLWLFLTVILALRLRGQPHFIHHHSFRAVNLAPMASHRWLARVGGSYSRHVFLSETMRDGYARAYLSSVQTATALVVPNAFLFTQDIAEPPVRSGPLTIGHLSVMTREKGVDYILALIERLLPETDYQFILAGPIKDDSLKAEVETMVAAHPGRVDWRGPVQGDRKAAFYAATDLFLLPSRLIDEADPLVLLEAFASGTVAMASKRGCIPDRVIDPSHLMVMDLEEDIPLIQAMAAQIKAERTGWARRCQAHATALFQAASEQGKTFLKSLRV